jgi:cell division transport system permease protein
MSLRSTAFLLGEAVTDIRRHSLMTLASITTVAISLSILGGFLLIWLHLNALAEALPRQFEIHAFTQAKVTPPQLRVLEARIRALSGVTEVRVVGREDAWREFQKRYGHPDDLASIRENPLPDKIEVRCKNPKRTLVVAKMLLTWPEFSRVKEGGKILERLVGIVSLVRTIGLTCAGLLLLATVAVVSNAIRITLFARRREIRIMQLVGAPNGFIRLPYLFEGFVDGGLGAVLACVLLGIGYRMFLDAVWKVMPLPIEFQSQIELTLFFALIAFLGVGTGMLGSFISIRRFLKI